VKFWRNVPFRRFRLGSGHLPSAADALSARRKKARHAPVRHCLVPLASRHNRDSECPSTADSERSMPVARRGHYGIAVMSRRDQDAAVTGRSSRGAARAGEARSTRARATGPGPAPRQWPGPGRRPRSAQWPPQLRLIRHCPLCACAFAWGMCGSWARLLPVLRSTRSIPLSR
jgi:hypothetical protein